ncbi:MAG: hypothetical protein HYX77_04515 [Acidobacteria bacterium]|nr:hypothetical protein [Acidobacteriota bacterium]
MKYRGLVILLGVLAAVIAVAWAPTAGQAPSTVSKTPWGDPDLQGIWRGVGSVPFERPAKWAGREFKTDEEVAALEKTANARNAERGKGKQENRGFRDQANYNSIVGYSPEWIRVPRRTSAIIDPPDGLLPPWTLEAVKRYEEREAVTAPRGDADWTIDRPPGERCISDFSVANIDAWGMGVGPGETAVYGGEFAKILANPDVNPGGEGINPNKGFGGPRRIIQAPGYVVFVDEQANNHQIIPLDGRPHLNKKFEQYQGDARGHWDGNTLVVDYRNVKSFGPVIPSYGSSIYPSGTETLRVIERYTRLGPDEIDYRYTVDDPSVYTRTYTVQFDLFRDDNYQISPVPCREGIDDMGTTLYGWRLDEDQATQNADETRAARKPVFERIKRKAMEAAAKGQSSSR